MRRLAASRGHARALAALDDDRSMLSRYAAIASSVRPFASDASPSAEHASQSSAACTAVSRARSVRERVVEPAGLSLLVAAQVDGGRRQVARSGEVIRLQSKSRPRTSAQRGVASHASPISAATRQTASRISACAKRQSLPSVETMPDRSSATNRRPARPAGDARVDRELRGEPRPPRAARAAPGSGVRCARAGLRTVPAARIARVARPTAAARGTAGCRRRSRCSARRPRPEIVEPRRSSRRLVVRERRQIERRDRTRARPRTQQH